MKKEVLVRNGKRVDMLSRSIKDGAASLESIPGLIRQVLEEDMWRGHLHEETGEVFQFENFKEFVVSPPPQGLGTNIATLIRLCADDALVVDMIDEAVQFTPPDLVAISHPVNGDGSQDGKKYIATGTSRQAGLRKLRQHAETSPKVEQLRQAVLTGEMSINKALIEAGLKSERITITRDPEKAAEVLKRSFSNEELQQLIRLLRS
jgi:hypothetical protein